MGTLVAMRNVDGEKLRELREERFLSHRELARLAGVSPTTVINLETKPEMVAQGRTIRKLASALEVEPIELTYRLVGRGGSEPSIAAARAIAKELEKKRGRGQP